MARRILSRLPRYDDEFGLQGDLAEEFASRCRVSGRRRAASWYRRQAFFAAGSSIVYSVQIGVAMFKNVMKVAFRTMLRFKLYSLINLLGLSVGLAVSLLALLYVRYETSFDDFHERPRDIHRIITRQLGNVYQGTDWWAVSPAILGESMKVEIPGVELAARVSIWGGLVRGGDKAFLEQRILFADPDIFKIFRIRVAAGNPAKALEEPLTIWPTREMARKYLGADDPVGKTLLYRNKFPLRVAGVVEELPDNSHLAFDFIAPISLLPDILGGDFGKVFLHRSGSLDFTTYVRLRAGTGRAEIERRLPAVQERFEAATPTGMPGMRNVYALQPLSQIHLHSRFNFDIARAANGDIRTVRLIAAVGFLILLIACFNFMNLATARSAVRAKEIGVRKAMGSGRKELRFQFFGESLLFALMACALAVPLLILSLPVFNRLLGNAIGLDLLARADVLLAGVGIVLFMAFVSGAYPALLLSSWSPVPILKGAAQSGGRKSTALRNAMVCLQFAASIALLAGTFVVGSQMRFVKAKDLGFQKDHILSVIALSHGLSDPEPFRNEILKNPRVLDFTTAGMDPLSIGSGGPEKLADGRELVFYRATGDAHFLDFFGMKIVRGRGFSSGRASDDRDALVINETAVRALGWTDPVGRILQTDGEIPEGRIIGVVRDFHFHPLRLPIMPLWFRSTTVGNAFFFVKVDPREMPSTLRFLEATWKKFSPDYPFSYQFLEDELDGMYADERAFSRLFAALAALAAFLACLGLVGLSTFTVERRMREIGIRRVLGASRSGIAGLLAEGFLKWVLVAAAAAFPVAWLAGRSWLNRFAYRIDLGLAPFAAALGTALALALLSVAVQSLRAGSADPAMILRNE